MTYQMHRPGFDRRAAVRGHFNSVEDNENEGGVMEDTTTSDMILVPMEREGAEALWAAANVGLDADPEDAPGLDLDAGFETNKAIRRALDNEAEAEVAVVQKGIAALEDLFSHDKDLIIIDAADGVGVLSGEAYASLYQLLALLRGDEGRD